MAKYKTPNGNIITQEELISKYGDIRFNELLSSGVFTPVDDLSIQQQQQQQDVQDTSTPVSSSNIYITPNKNEITEEDLIQKYGESQFKNYVNTGVLKKKGGMDSYLEDTSLASQPTEKDFFEGSFGNFLRGVDDIVPLGLGDFVDDMARSVAQGFAQGIASENAADLLLRGSEASLEDIQSFIDSQKNAAQYTPSKEMQDYQRIYEENGKGFLGVVLGFVQNPTILAEVFLSSMTSMATNTDSLLAAAGVVGAGAATGAAAAGAAGTVAGPVGTAVGLGAGATAGGLASLPYAFAAAGTVLEMGSTFAELLTEAAGGRELTKEVIQELLNNEDVYTDIRNKAVARGIAIGAIDAFTGKLGGKIGSKVLTKSGKIAADAATKGRKIASIAAAGGVEGVGGSLGEVGGRLAADQEMDISEIALEGIAEVPGSVKDMISARYAKPTYKVNGEKVPAETLDNLIETMTLEQLQAAKIQIDNDYDGRAGKLQNRVEELSTKKQIQEANPEINEPTLNEMAKLQLELNKLQGNNTEVAKTKASELKEKIKALQEAPLEKEVKEEVAQAEVVTEAAPEATTEEEFDQLEEEDKLSFLEQVQGDKQAAINLFAEDTKKAQEIYRGTLPAKTQEEVNATLLEEPSVEQQLADIQNGDIVTFEYKSENEIPEAFKDKISSRGENNGNPFVRVTVAKSLADFNLQEQPSEVVSSKTQEEGEFVVQGTFRGDQVIAGNEEYRVKDYRQTGQAGRTELVENTKGDKKIFTLVTPNKDVFGRRGYMGVSLVLPNTTTKTNAEIESILKAKTEEVNSNLDKKAGRLKTDINMAYKDSQGGRFRLADKKEVASNKEDVEAIKNEMNQMPQQEKEFVEPSPSKADSNAIAIDESNATDKESKLEKVLKFLGFTEKSQLYRRIEDFNGIPMMLGMSDMLASGEIKDSMGNPMSVDGGLLFNTLGNNIELAWAGVTKDGATTQYNNAVAIYESNKELFDRLWKEGKIPDGHIPMAIMRMGNTAVNSNEAVFRYILPYVQSLPLKNRKAALQQLKATLVEKADGNSSTIWMSDFSDRMESGEIDTADGIREYLNNIIKNGKNKGQIESAQKQLEAFEKKIVTVRNRDRKADQNTIDETAVEETAEAIAKKVENIKAFVLNRYITDNKITTLDAFIDSIIKESKSRAEGQQNIFSLPMRALIYNTLISSEKEVKEGGKAPKNSLQVIKTLLDGVKNAKNEIFTSNHIYNAIGEPSMMNSSQGDVVSIVGIDVKNGGVGKASHNNYGFGPKGRLISLISNPMSGMDVFPEFKAKASRIFKKNKGGSYPNQEAVTSQVGGAFFMDAAFRNARPAVGEMNDLQVLIGKLRFAFPSVSVSTSKEEFENSIDKLEKKKYSKDGIVIYGFTKDGKIFINPSYKSLKTPIHEFGHIWIDFLRSPQSGKKGAALLNQGLDLVKGTKEYEDAVAKYGEGELAKEEALVELMATKGNTIIDAAKKSQFKSWMNAVFKYIKEKFTTFKDLKVTTIKDLTLDEFINVGLADLFGGKAVSTSFSPAKSEYASKARYELGDNVVKFIKDARTQGISEAAINITLRRNGVSNEDIVSGLEKSKDKASVRTELSETFLEGYDRMINEVDGIIKKSKERGRTDAEILKNITEYIMGSKAYENATDVQRDKLIRDARKMMGVREKSAPSAGRLIGVIKDIKNITMSEKELLYKRLKDFEEGAKTAKEAWVNASRQLAEEIDELKKKGKISSAQMANVISKFSKVNMFNPASIERFIDYMAKVFNDAEYANKMENANTKRKVALANIANKIGISDILTPNLQRLFSINPSLIPMNVLDKYISLVNTFSERKAVLSLPPLEDMINLSDDVLNAIDEEQSQILVLADRLNASENKVFNDDGSLNYAETLKEMFKKEEITEDELEIMKKYKSQILPKKVTEAMTEAEIEAKKKELIKQIEKSDAMKISYLPSRDERSLAGRLETLLRTDALKSLSINELENILRVLDNINNGYLPHFTQLVVERLNDVNKGKQLSDSIDVAKPLPFTSIYARLKSIITKKGSIQEMVRRNPLFYIDQVFGNFKTKDIFDSVFGMASEEVAKFRSSLKNVQDRITKAEQAVINSFDKDGNKFVMSKYKQMAYMIQEEFLSNPNNKQVNSVVEFLKATVKRIDEETTSYTKRDADMLQSILDTYTDSNGNFDNQALYNSFNSAEKQSIKTLQDINLELGPKAVYTAAIIRGDKIKPRQNYVHLNVLSDTTNMDANAAPSFIESFNNSLRPSTKAKSLIERTGKVSALNFDVYSSVQKGAKFVLMDYHLTEPIRTARRTLNQAEKNLTKNGRMDSDKRKVFNAIKNAFEEATSNLLENSFTETSIMDDAFEYVKKQGYRAILASGSRFIGELTSNVSFALIADPKGFIAGTKLRGFISSPEALQAMNNLNSVQTNRIFPNDSLSGRMVDTNGFNETKGTKGGKARSSVSNYISKLWNKTGQRWVNGVEVTADMLISTPDKLIMRPMWFGAFDNRFKELTGKSPDFDKIAANDEAYMEANKEALKQATELADKRSVMAGATDNAFMGMLKGTSKPNQKISIQAFNAFNNFMTRFLIFEYITARSGVMSLIGRGEMSKKQGAAVIGAVMSRMVLYTLIGQMLAEAMTGMFDGDDEEDKAEDSEPKNKSFDKKLGQAFASSFTSLLFGRDFGNATKSIINLGVEEFNKEQLDFLRNGDYDPYKDAIQYTIAPTDKPGKQTGLGDILMKLGAAYGPALKTADLIVRKTLEPKRKEEDAIKRQEDERFVRIPLEILGNLGFIPMYKDIRKAVLTNMYKDLAKAERTAGDKKKAREEMLQGYENESDMKRYDRELWDRTYGPNSPNYDAIKAEKELDKQKRKIRQQLKDEMYDYTPKVKTKGSNTFGGSSFGSGSSSSTRRRNNKGGNTFGGSSF